MSVVAAMAATAGLALALAACGSGSGGTAADDGSTTTVESTTTTAVVALRPPGTEIAPGLVVPDGAQLAGAAFVRSAEEQQGGQAGWDAHLVIDGDPFAVWDDLAGQLRALDPAAGFSGSADGCAWRFEEQIVDGGSVVTLDGSDVEGAPADPTVVTAEAPGGSLLGVECSAGATMDVGDGFQTFFLSLDAGSDRPTSATLTAIAERGSPGARSWGIRTGDGPAPAPSPDPVPAGAADHLPASPPTPVVEEGDPFGSDVNCFSGTGYTRTLLPAGATWVADIGFGNVSVLAVDDPRAAIEALQAQFEAGGPDESSGIRTVELADGTSILTYSHGVSAGGGGCTVRSSPDGRFVQVSRYAD